MKLLWLSRTRCGLDMLRKYGELLHRRYPLKPKVAVYKINAWRAILHVSEA